MSPLYVVFTSGSTGTPKGVVITHSNFTSAMFHQRERLGFDESSRVLDFASYAFDVAWSNLLHTLNAGGCLCIPSEDDRRQNFSGSIARFKATYIEVTPAAARLIDSEDAASLRTINLSGEALGRSDIATWMAEKMLLNTYGPAECTVTATCAQIKQPFLETPSIGTAMGCVTWIVDPLPVSRQLSPIGSVGELWIEGPIVGSEYLGDAAKTQASFVADMPWLSRKELPDFREKLGRCYRTGDLVRYNADGTIVFVGRTDTQVKIRGQRVELSEVELHVRAQLITELSIRHANGIPTVGDNAFSTDTSNVTVTAEVISPRGSVRSVLVAFITIGSKAAKSQESHARAVRDVATGLSEALSSRTPSYMIPDAYIPLASMPLTSSAKIDRHQLRRIGSELSQADLANGDSSHGHPCKSPMEQRVQALWAAVLNIPDHSIMANAHFFQIGGDSIEAMRLVSHARKAGLHIAVADVFQHCRLRDLALVLDKRLEIGHTPECIGAISPFSLLQAPVDIEQVKQSAATLCGLSQNEVEDVYPCSPMQEGLLAMTAQQDGYIAHVSQDLRPTTDAKRFLAAWEEVVAHAAILRTRVVDLPGRGLVQVVSKPYRGDRMEVTTTPLHGDGFQAMGLGTPLSQHKIVRKPDSEDFVFVWKVHHSIYDAWTISLLLAEQRKAYERVSLEAPIQYQAFIRYIAGARSDAARAYWCAQLEDLSAPVFPKLPSPQYRPKSDESQSISVHSVHWHGRAFTASTIVRAAWSILTSRYCCSEDVLFGSVVSGRQAPVPGIERLIAPTIATVPVRVKIQKDQNLATLLQDIQT
jgi:amino acid adenylation domain-containing protein